MPLPTASPDVTEQPIGTQPVSVLGATGSLQDRIARLETRLDFLSDYTAFLIQPNVQSITATTAPHIVAALTIPWGLLRSKLQIPNARWDAYLSGWLGNAGGSTTVGLYYWKNDSSYVLLGSTVIPPTGNTKVAVGPFPARGPYAAAAGAPQTEQVPSYFLSVSVSAGTASVSYWTLWIRQSPTRS